MSAILAYADKCPQEKESARNCLIVMFPQHDKKSEPIWMLGLGAEQSANRQELGLCLAVMGKQKVNFTCPWTIIWAKPFCRTWWGIEIVTVQMSSSFTFNLLAAWFCVILSCSEKMNEKWTSLIRVTSVVSVSSFTLSLLHVKQWFLFILFFPSTSSLKK